MTRTTEGGVLFFTVLGDPVPKQRPRIGRSGRAYTPKRTRSFENEVAWTAKAAGIREPLRGSLVLEVSFYRGSRRRCDTDNLVKSVMDGLQGVAYVDDSQVAGLVVWREIDRRRPRTEIRIGSLGLGC